MPVEIEILDTVIERLQFLTTPGFSNLYGVSYKGKLLVIGFGKDPPSVIREFSLSQVGDDSEENEELESDEFDPFDFEVEEEDEKNSNSSAFSQISESLISMSSDSKVSFFDKRQVIYPTGVDHIGVLGLRNGHLIDNDTILSLVKDVHVTNTPIYIEKDNDKDKLSIFYTHDGQVLVTVFTIMSTSTFQEQFCYLRLLSSLSVFLPVRKEPSLRRSREIRKLAKRISQEMIFRIGKSDLIISFHHMFHSLHSSIGRIFDASKKHKDFRTGQEVLNVYGFFPSHIQVDFGKTCYAPFVIDYSRSRFYREVTNIVAYHHINQRFFINVEIPFDGLCLVHRDRSVRDIYSLLIDAAERTLFLAEIAITECREDPFGLQVLRFYHFLPKELGHPVSLVLLEDEPDNELGVERMNLHDCLHLPTERPLFTKKLALNFVDSSQPPLPLMNVHEGLKSSGLKSSQKRTALVYGHYQYHHYMQDINDSGWGCAYRSLQTIISWFILQGYTAKSIPSHKQIQEALVAIGDKNQKFIGSKTWIGSTEVSYVLEYYIEDVSSVIINVPSGSEMYTMGPVLYEHFLLQGTPVMIGGGVLAHTIIGVDYDEESTEVKFLILDPHYTGEDDVATIQKKGFVGWKGVDFWDKGAFYNLCLPQRPIRI